MGGIGELASGIGSHNETMLIEGANIEKSKQELENKYNAYLADNQNLMSDWQGDTADVFANYSNNMNRVLSDAIGITGDFQINVNTFYNRSFMLDSQASMSAEGEK